MNEDDAILIATEYGFIFGMQYGALVVETNNVWDHIWLEPGNYRVQAQFGEKRKKNLVHYAVFPKLPPGNYTVFAARWPGDTGHADDEVTVFPGEVSTYRIRAALL